MLTILLSGAISLLFALLAGCAILSIIASMRNGIVRGRAIVAELALLEAGRRPVPVVRTIRLRPAAVRYAVRRPIAEPLRWQHGAAA